MWGLEDRVGMWGLESGRQCILKKREWHCEFGVGMQFYKKSGNMGLGWNAGYRGGGGVKQVLKQCGFLKDIGLQVYKWAGSAGLKRGWQCGFTQNI